ASSRSAGLLIASPSRTTIVSAAITSASPVSPIAAAFARASRSAASNGSSPGESDSSTSAWRTSNVRRRDERISRRGGEEDARRMRIARVLYAPRLLDDRTRDGETPARRDDRQVAASVRVPGVELEATVPALRRLGRAPQAVERVPAD